MITRGRDADADDDDDDDDDAFGATPSTTDLGEPADEDFDEKDEEDEDLEGSVVIGTSKLAPRPTQAQ